MATSHEAVAERQVLKEPRVRVVSEAASVAEPVPALALCALRSVSRLPWAILLGFTADKMASVCCVRGGKLKLNVGKLIFGLHSPDALGAVLIVVW